MALSVLVSSLAVTTLGQTVSPELTTPEGADPVGDKAEEGFVLDPATLVLGREDLHRRCSGNILVLGMRIPARVVSGVQRPPPRNCNAEWVLQRGWCGSRRRDVATLVLGDEDLHEKMFCETDLVLEVTTPAGWCPVDEPCTATQKRYCNVRGTATWWRPGILALQRRKVLRRDGVQTPTSPRNCNVTSAATPCEALEESAVEQLGRPAMSSHWSWTACEGKLADLSLE